MKILRPAWDSYYTDRAVKAVKKMTDTAKLLCVAKKAQNADARVAALDKLTGQSLLFDVAMHATYRATNSNARNVVVNRLTGQGLLAEVAQHARDDQTRVLAADKLEDRGFAQKVYADVAKNSKDSDYFTTDRLTDQGLLADVAKNAINAYVRRAAVERLTDQSVLAEVAKNDKNADVREAAVKRLTLPDVLTEIMNGSAEDYRYVWEQPVSKCSGCVDNTDEGLTCNHITPSTCPEKDGVRHYAIDLRKVARERLAELNLNSNP